MCKYNSVCFGKSHQKIECNVSVNLSQKHTDDDGLAVEHLSILIYRVLTIDRS